ncbi:MAG: hypothetical protein ACFCU6_05760 [Balneolaceae bacterium]
MNSVLQYQKFIFVSILCELQYFGEQKLSAQDGLNCVIGLIYAERGLKNVANIKTLYFLILDRFWAVIDWQ